MTIRRLIASLAAAAGVMAVTAFVVAHEFPLEARAPQHAPPATDATTPVAIVQGGEHLLHAALPEFPARALDRKIEGTVVLEIAVDDHGEVSDARVISGPDELRRAALESVLQWHYFADKVSHTTIQVALQFNPAGIVARKERMDEEPLEIAVAEDGRTSKLYTLALFRKPTPGQDEDIELESAKIQQALADPTLGAHQREKLEVRLAVTRAELARHESESDAAEPQRLVAVKTERVAPEIVEAILNRTGLSIGAVVSKTMVTEIRETIEAFDPHLPSGSSEARRVA